MRRDEPPPGLFGDRERYDSRPAPRGLPAPPAYGAGGWDHGGWDSPPADRRALSYGQGGYDIRGKRGRSRSPPPSSFYERRGLPGNGHDGRGYNDDYRRSGSQPHGSRSAAFAGPEPPDSLPFLVSFQHFSDWLRFSQPHQATSAEAVAGAFEQYKLRFLHRTTTAFFDEMKGKPWFKEKYSPEKDMVELRERQRDRTGPEKADRFVAELEGGRLDQLDFDWNAQGTHTSVAPSVEPEQCDGDNGSSRREEDDPVTAAPAVAGPSTVRLSGEYVELEQNARQLFIKTVTPELAFTTLEAHCAKAPGFSRLMLSDPNPAKKFHRFGWIEFDSAESVPEAENILGESSVENFTLHLQQNTTATKLKPNIAPPASSAPTRLATDLGQIRLVASGFEKAAGVDGRASELIEHLHQAQLDKLERDKPVSGEHKFAQDSVSLTKRTLDLYLHYLRLVFSSCYYCVASYDHTEQLHRRCAAHFRRQPDEQRASKKQDSDWARELDEKLVLWTEPGKVNPAAFGGVDFEEELLAVCGSLVEQEGEGKFRCGECSKLFSAARFVAKHLHAKHPERLETGKLERAAFLNSYALDPNKLVLGPGDAARPPVPAGPPLSFAMSAPAPAGPPMKIEDVIQSYGGTPDRGPKRMRRSAPFDDREERTGPPPPPPVGARLDPRAGRRATAYDDLDS